MIIEGRPRSGIRQGFSSTQVEIVLAALVTLLDARAGILRIRSGHHDESRLLAAHGLPADLLAREKSVTGPCGVCGAALQRKSVRPCYPEAGRDTPSRRRFDHGDCTATVALSLDHRGESVGVFALFFDHPGRLPNDLAPLLRAAGQLLAFVVKRTHEKGGAAASSPKGPFTRSDRLSTGSLEQPLRSMQAQMLLCEGFSWHGSQSKRRVGWTPTSLLSSTNPPSDTENPAHAAVAGLTVREWEVLNHLAAGQSNKGIARELGISHNTVKIYVHRIFAKLGLSSRLQAVLYVMKFGASDASFVVVNENSADGMATRQGDGPARPRGTRSGG